MNNTVSLGFALSASASFFSLMPTTSLAQDNEVHTPPAKVAATSKVATVTLNSAAYSRFDAILQAVSEQAHVLIIAEGTPLNPSLSVQQLEALHRVVPEGQPVSVEDAIKNIALAYDYDTEQTYADTYLLRKRYSDANDLPCVTFEEVFSSLREIRKALGHDTDEDLDTDTTLAKFVDSLTPAQRQQGHMPDYGPNPSAHVTMPLDTSNTGLAIGDLSPSQQELGIAVLKSVALNNRLTTIDLVVNRYFTALKKGAPNFRWVDARLSEDSKVRALGIEGAFGADGKQREIPFVSPFKFDFNVNSQYIAISAKELTPIDPLAPTAQDRALASGMMTNLLPPTLTLQEAAREAAKTLPISFSAANSPRGTADGSATRANAAKTIADKPVNVFGMRYGRDVRHLMQSLADLYGLQLLVPTHNDYALALPEHRAVDTPEDYPKELQRLTPLPLRRALEGQEASMAKAIGEHPKEIAHMARAIPDGIDEKTARGILEVMIGSVAKGQTNDAFYFPAARRLIALTEPKVSGPDARPVPVRALAPEADRLLALMLLSGEGMRELRDLQRFVPPPSLAQPDTAHLQFFYNKSPSSRTYSIAIYHVNADGSYVSEGSQYSYSHFEVPSTSLR